MNRESQDKRPKGVESTMESSFDDAAVRLRALIGRVEHNLRIMTPRFEPSVLDLVADMLREKMRADVMVTAVASVGMEKERLDDLPFFQLRHEAHFQLLIARLELKERIVLVDMRHGYLERRADPEQRTSRYTIFLNEPRSGKDLVGKFSTIANKSQRFRDRQQ